MGHQLILWIVAGGLVGLLLLFGLGLEALRGYSAGRLRELLRQRKNGGEEGAAQTLDARLAREEALVSATQHWLTFVEVGLLAVLVVALPTGWSQALRLLAAIGATAASVVLFRRGVAVALAAHRAEETLLRLLPILAAAAVVMRPVSAVERFVVKVVGRLMGVHEGAHGHEVIQEEILEAVDEGEREGVLTGEEAEMIERVMGMTELAAHEVMTPRTDIVWLSATATLAEAAAVVTQCGHSRIPVYSGNRDNVVGVLYAKDLLLPLSQEGQGDRPVSDVARRPLFVPETKPVWQLLQEFRTSKVHVAIVVDEYGGTAGLITVEDILEEVVGEIADEYDREPPPPLKRLADDTAEVDARMRVDELNQELGTHVPEDEDYDTIGGLAFSVLGRVPAAGEQFRVSDVDFTILEAGDHRVRRLRVRIRPEE